ncbi:MAG: VUT family protein [Treponema sp.]|nr:VUT family protein [Treponema sp.]
MKYICTRLKKESAGFRLLLRSIPSVTVSVFILSVVCANLMANKELVSFRFLALDCGFVFSWIMFLCMDVICKRWGAKASIQISALALVINLCVCGIFALLALAPGKWGQSYVYAEPSAAYEVNKSLNATFAGTWYVVLGSALAFMVSSCVNAVLNAGAGKFLAARGKHDGFAAFAFRSYISTAVAQLADNLIFAVTVSKIFFGWTWTQVVACSCAGVVAELLAEVIFSGLGYRVLCIWEKDSVGKDYLDYMNIERSENESSYNRNRRRNRQGMRAAFLTERA